MTIKEIVENLWRDFEIVAFKAVKNSLPKDIIVSETLTQAIKDGGYDGEFILMAQDDIAFRVVFEAKLRSDTKAALSLTDFAKALVIAVVRQADMIFVVTNLRFSSGTISTLVDYARSISLDIQLLNGYSVKEFVRSHGDILGDVDIELKKFLLSQNKVSEAQSVNVGATFLEEHTALLDPVRAVEYEKQARIFSKGRGILLVRGNAGCGKSHYIEELFHAMKRTRMPACLIDLSSCATYKDLFLKIMEHTLGLSLSLVDLLDEESFTASFVKIGVSDTDKDEIRMLKYLFSRESEYPYDYSFLFEKIVEFYYKIFQAAKRKVVISFTNLVYAQKEVLQLLLYFLKGEVVFPCVLEIADDDFWEEEVESWATVKQMLSQHASFPPHIMKKWTANQAKQFLREQTKGLSEAQIASLVRKFGQTPAELSSLVELIHYSDIYANTPTELVYREICALDPSKNNALYGKCLEYMQYTNSDIAYIYAFVFLLCGEVKLTLLDCFLGDSERFWKSIRILRRSQLFAVTGQSISLKSQKIEECFLAYCIANLYAPTISQVAVFIERNLGSIHLNAENMLEMRSRVAYYEDSEKCIELLATLGDTYLKMEQSALAEKKYRAAYELETDIPELQVPMPVQLRIQLGLSESLIWKIGKHRDEIAHCLNSSEEMITLATGTEREYLLLTLRYYRLAYQFQHAQGNRGPALHYAQQGVNLIEKNNLQTIALDECGKMWRFYAVAVKENTQDIFECLNAFDRGRTRCAGSAKFLFGYIIHKNMTVDAASAEQRLRIKLDNYKELYPLDKQLSVDEYLHYRTNVAALHFLQKEYETAWTEYQELLGKSVIFNIAREEVRILNDMANICWIRDEPDEAHKMYVRGKERAEISGCFTNYWPLLVNLTSFEIQHGDSARALELSKKLRAFLLQVCLDMSSEKFSFERKEYCDAAIAIQLKNLWRLYEKYDGEWLLENIKELLEKSGARKMGQVKSEKDVKDAVLRLEPKGTLFDHNGLYLLKD